jgi:branched-chain amino acid transport system ATP-binding protein
MLSIQTLDVYYTYIQVLKKISLEAMKGKVTAVLGPNGGGKTTLLKAIVNLIPVRKGKVLFNGVDIVNWGTEKIISSGLTLVPERREIFTNLSVRDNLLIGAYPRFRREPKKNIQKDIDFVYSLFPILNQRFYQKGRTLSGGEQQMLAIGRALMLRPEMLLLDEPSLGLAPLVVQEIFRILKRLQGEGTTLLLVEQKYEDALSIAERSYVLQTGKIIWAGQSTSINEETIRNIYMGGERRQK